MWVKKMGKQRRDRLLASMSRDLAPRWRPCTKPRAHGGLASHVLVPHVGQDSTACSASMRAAASNGCDVTAACPSTCLKEPGATQRHVAQSMQVWST